jgi:hypothetical protein
MNERLVKETAPADYPPALQALWQAAQAEAAQAVTDLKAALDRADQQREQLQSAVDAGLAPLPLS